MATPPGDPEAQAKFAQAADFAADRLAQFEPRDRVIDDLVEKFGIDYPEAESMMRYVEANDETEVEVRQMPMILIIGIGTSAIGIAILAAYLMYPLRHPWVLVTGIGMIMGGLVGLLEAAFGLVSGLFKRG